MAQLSSQLLEIESRLRELATDIQLRKLNVQSASNEIHHISEKLDSILKYDLGKSSTKSMKFIPPEYVDAIQALTFAARILNDVYVDFKYREDIPKENPNIEINNKSEVRRFFEHLEEAVKKATGQGCLYRVSNTTASYLNDLASCAHVLAKKIQEIENIPLFTLSDKCSASEGAEESLMKACEIWDKATTEIDNEYTLYEPEDYDALRAVIMGKKAYFKVGDAPGHDTLIDLGRGRLEYYDRDYSVNRVMSTLFEEEAGLSCKVHDMGVTCEGVNPSNVDKVALALSFATSMDFRLSNPAKYWGGGVVRELELKNVKEYYKDLAKKLLAK
ncbi:MAG: hypothetical protein ABWK01_01525 [Infirmifilum sp.]